LEFVSDFGLEISLSPNVLKGKSIYVGLHCAALFEDDNILFAARELAEMNTKELLAKIRLRMDYLDCFFDREQFQRINDTVMNYLIKNSSHHLAVAKRLY